MLVIVIFILLIIFILMNMGGSNRVNKNNGKKWTIYGTMGCGWTRKQLEYMKRVGKPYKFIDCDKGIVVKCQLSPLFTIQMVRKLWVFVKFKDHGQPG